ncbi:hypothetical protein IWW39_004987 [Coemansia spiralis]|uniref:Uncharacterized protein n=1 Tax=Coemansia spiralis TaxID=417178 RepID=A0A9W8L2V9_9FUNG|nr:hypothetical protein IWW39_004987 [Coemansia spiralis]
MFRSTSDSSASPTSTGSLPFGLNFDSTLSVSSSWSSSDSSPSSEVSPPLILLSTRTRHPIHNHNSHHTASEHGATTSDIEEELSGLENAAAKNAMSLVAMVATSLLAMTILI